MSTLKRIKEYIDLKGINIKRFEESVGFSNGAFASQLKNDKTIGVDKLENILSVYSEINPEWLLTGKGSILKKNENEQLLIQHIHTPSYKERISDDEIPVYNIDAAANLKTLLENKSQNIIDKLRIPDIPKCDGAIYVRGDSMYPLLKSGDIVAYKELHDFDSILFGEMYLVDYVLNDEEFLVVKYVKRSDIKGRIRLVSYNANHDPMDIPIEGCIRAMALVKASVRINTMK